MPCIIVRVEWPKIPHRFFPSGMFQYLSLQNQPDTLTLETDREMYSH